MQVKNAHTLFSHFYHFRIKTIIWFQRMDLQCLFVSVMLSTAFNSVQALTSSEIQQFKDNGLTVTTAGDYIKIEASGIPDHQTASYPNSNNPNTIQQQDYDFYIPNPQRKLDSSACLNMGYIGVTKTGIPVYNPYTIQGYNAVEGSNAETFDLCNGHPDPSGRYHYHKMANCMNAAKSPDNTLVAEEFIGVAMDGYPIYSAKLADGTVLTSSDLDECNGRNVSGVYRYHVTTTFPYYLGCYKGYVDMNKLGSRGQCYFADVAQPANGRNSLRSGTANNGQTFVLSDSGSSGAANCVPTFASIAFLLATLYLVF